jgi:hypothetical protein
MNYPCSKEHLISILRIANCSVLLLRNTNAKAVAQVKKSPNTAAGLAIQWGIFHCEERLARQCHSENPVQTHEDILVVGAVSAYRRWGDAKCGNARASSREIVPLLLVVHRKRHHLFSF